MVLGSQDTSLAAAPQRVPAKAQSSGSPIANTGDAERLRLRLTLFDTVGLPEKVSGKMQLEVEEIFEQFGVATDWYQPPPVRQNDNTAPGYFLKVILSSHEPSVFGLPHDVMGLVNGTQSPPDVAWLFDPAIRRVLQGSGSRARRLNAEEEARAYARVMAHEIFHAIANDHRHAKSGLMAPVLTDNVLTAARMAVDGGSKAAFLRGLARVQIGNAAPASDAPRQ